MNKLNFQTLFFCITIVVNIQYSYSQTDFDYSALDGMDSFSRPDLFGQQYAAFNGLSRAEKLQILENAGSTDDTWKNAYERREDVGFDNKFECAEFGKQKAINMFGCKNMNNYVNIHKFDTTKMRDYNIPVFMVATDINPEAGEGINTAVDGHWINGIFVGPENSEEKPDPRKFNQWKFFEPQKEGIHYVEREDFSMNANGKVHIYWFGWQPNAFGEWKHADRKIIEFNLENGVPKEGNDFWYSPSLLKEDPHTLYVDMNDENMFVERGANEPDLSEENLGTPSAQTNSEYSTPSVEKVSSKFTPFNENYPEYGVQENVYKGEISTGRWNGTNLEGLVDSMKRRITVDDTIDPIIYAPNDITVNKGSSIEPDVTGVASFSDASPYGVEMWYEDSIVSEDTNYRVIERTHFGKDVRDNIGSAKQTITVDLNTGIKEAFEQGGFDLEPQYGPNGINLKTFTSKPGDISIEVFDIQGRMLLQKHYDSWNKKDFWIRNNGLFKSGTYIARGTFIGDDGKATLEKEKILIK